MAAEGGRDALARSALDATQCGVFSYYNFEAVPEAITHDKPFSATLFKNNWTRVPDSDAARSALDFWALRSPRGESFLFYQNGKAAVRCSLDAVPISVHVWCPVEKRRLKSIGWTNDTRNHGLVAHGEIDCAVLHYACTDPEILWQKYHTLGNFPRECVGGTAEHEINTFHVQCRDHYLRHAGELDEGRQAMRELFERVIMLDQAEARAPHAQPDTFETMSS